MNVNEYKLLMIIKEPHVSEKATKIGSEGQYVFKVPNNTNKLQVKKAVESIFNTQVASVNIVNVLGKIKRYGRSGKGCRAAWKKAYISLKKGNTINFDVLPE
jgi:large subunit ribosomal protein L23